MNINVELLCALLVIAVTLIIELLYMAFMFGKMEQKITNLEKKQDKHNNLIERTFKIESDVKVIQEHIVNETREIECIKENQNACIRTRHNSN